MKKLTYLLLAFLSVVVFQSCRQGSGDVGVEKEEHTEDHEHGGETSEVELTRQQMDAVGISLGKIETRDMVDVVSAPGVIEVDSRDETYVSALLPGVLTRLDVAVGQRVEPGDVIAYVEAPEMLAMYQEYQAAQQEMVAARVEAERQEALASQGAGVKKNLDNARAALSMAELRVEQARQKMKIYGVESEAASGKTVYPVKAGKAGVVTSIDATPGSYADPQTPILKTTDPDGVYCMAALPEKDINKITAGMEVEMTLTNASGTIFAGVVEDIVPILDAATKTVPVRVRIEDAGTLLLIPGMAVNCRIAVSGKGADVLPEEAVVRTAGRTYIFVLEDMHEENGEETYHFKKIEIVAGKPSMGYVEVTPLEHLEEDADIVTSGAFYLNSMSTEHGEHTH